MSRPVVVFDLDGTLVDSAPGIARVLDAMRAERGMPPCALDDVRQWIGLGAPALIGAALEVDATDIAPALADFRARYGRTPTPRVDMYAGTEAALCRLRASGARLGVCSNKPHALTEKVLTDLGIRALFDGVAGGDAVAACKPDPMHLNETLLRMGCAGAPFVFVGDSLIDADAADAAGARFLWVAYGYGAAADLAGRGERVDAADEIGDKVLGQFA
ncbi:MAG TPA: HAD-IA family hydrolase [Burkholderiaceae bacterium]|nr:HAD-IA family hydrolase [Burkholderiaceae bacterium]